MNLGGAALIGASFPVHLLWKRATVLASIPLLWAGETSLLYALRQLQLQKAPVT
jgi:hypothetical protein